MTIQKYELLTVHGLEEDELDEGANHFAEKAVEAFKTSLISACQAGNFLNEMKSRTPHGQWMAKLRARFNYSHQTAATYMHLASNFKRLKFDNLSSIRDAVRYLEDLDAEEESEIVPRSERKTGRVKVDKPVDESRSVPGEESIDVDKRPVDDDPNPAPKTNTHHSPATAKAKEAERAVPMAVTPVIVEEPVSREESEEQIVETWVKETGFHDSVLRVAELSTRLTDKARAKVLRTIADKFDPPAVGAPNIEAVQEWATSEGIRDFDAEKFFNHYALAGWKYGKAKTPIKDWRRAAINAYSGGKGWAVDGANRLPF